MKKLISSIVNLSILKEALKQLPDFEPDIWTIRLFHITWRTNFIFQKLGSLPGFLLENHFTWVSAKEPSYQGSTKEPSYQGSTKEPSYQGSTKEPFLPGFLLENHLA